MRRSVRKSAVPQTRAEVDAVMDQTDWSYAPNYNPNRDPSSPAKEEPRSSPLSSSGYGMDADHGGAEDAAGSEDTSGVQVHSLALY